MQIAVALALGYAEGKNIVIEFRWAEGNYVRDGHQPQTAKALGLTIPQSLLGRTDEVIR